MILFGVSNIGKKDKWLIGALVLAAAVLMVIVALGNQGRQSAGNLIVYVDGAEYCRVPIRSGEALVIAPDEARKNVIRMTESGFYMESASCPHHECVDQGEVNAENWKQRKLQEQVICLPNRVVVALDLTTSQRLNQPDF